MLFDFVPNPNRLRPLPEALTAASSLRLSRLKAGLASEDFAFFSAQPNFAFVVGMSDFVTQTLLRFPRECRGLFEAGALDHLPETFARVLTDRLAQIGPGLADAVLRQRLRCIRRSMLVPVAWLDLTGALPLQTVFECLCLLAERIVLTTVQTVRTQLVKVCGDALDDDGTPLPLLIYAMGKLGGRELNFSSDLDLIFAYPHEGETSGGSRQLSFREFYARIVQRFTGLLADVTADGFCYRIDLRLRPFGDAGALVNSFDAMQCYYETQGRTWERYALIKARILGDASWYGSYGTRLREMLTPFVFRRYLDFGAIDSLRKLKLLIEAEVRHRKLENNFKLGAGGIREIEFIAQVFQLIRGGRIPQLRTRGLRRTLKLLTDFELLPPEVGSLLDICYQYLRRLENCVQEFADRQTQDVPENPDDRLRIALAMNKDSFEEFRDELTQVTSAVHGEFAKVVNTGADDSPQDEIGSGLWESTLSQDELSAALRPVLREDTDSAAFAKAVMDLRTQLAAMPVGPVGSATLRLLMPRIITLCSRRGDPVQTFVKAGMLISRLALRTTYLQLLQENGGVLERLLSLLEENALASDMIRAHPILLDELIMPQYLHAPLRPEEFLQLLQERLARFDPADLEQQMEELRLFKTTMVLRIAMSDQSGSLPLMQISDSLSWLAEAMLRELLALAWEQTASRYGHPAERSQEDPGMAIIAYGKLGGIELGYKSDLDMVMIRGNDADLGAMPDGRPPALFYQRLVQRLMHLATTRTSGGVLYDLDMRLRPDGDSGMLITDVEGFGRYQLERAWTWEHQALVRARAVAGSPDICEAFDSLRGQVLRMPRDGERLRDDVAQMRLKMSRQLCRVRDGSFDLKHSPGGMVDIEFIAQYLLLREASQHPDMVLWSDNVRILDECARIGVLRETEAAALKAAYLELRDRYHRLSLAEKPGIVPAGERPEACGAVLDLWQSFFGSAAGPGSGS